MFLHKLPICCDDCDGNTFYVKALQENTYTKGFDLKYYTLHAFCHEGMSVAIIMKNHKLTIDKGPYIGIIHSA